METAEQDVPVPVPAPVDWEARAKKLEEQVRKCQRAYMRQRNTLEYIAQFGYKGVVRNREAECRAYREQLAQTQACQECELRVDTRWPSNVCPYCQQILVR